MQLLTIGDKTFSSKTSAIKFYKEILDKYNFGETLSDEDAKYLIALGFKEEGTPEEVAEFSEEVVADFYEDNDESFDKLLGVMVDRHPDFRTTKCFLIPPLLRWNDYLSFNLRQKSYLYCSCNTYSTLRRDGTRRERNFIEEI